MTLGIGDLGFTASSTVSVLGCVKNSPKCLSAKTITSLRVESSLLTLTKSGESTDFKCIEEKV